MTQGASLYEAWQALKPHWHIAPTKEPLPKTPSYSALRMFLSPFLRPVMNAKLLGLHNIPRKGAVILAANHLSHVDPILIIASARRTTHYLAKDGHFKNAALRTVMRATGQIETSEIRVVKERSQVLQTFFLKVKHWVFSPKERAQKRLNHPTSCPGKPVLLGLLHPIPKLWLYR